MSQAMIDLSPLWGIAWFAFSVLLFIMMLDSIATDDWIESDIGRIIGGFLFISFFIVLHILAIIGVVSLL